MIDPIYHAVQQDYLEYKEELMFGHDAIYVGPRDVTKDDRSPIVLPAADIAGDYEEDYRDDDGHLDEDWEEESQPDQDWDEDY